MKIIDLDIYENNHQLYDEISIIATVKSFDLQAIRNRYIKSATNKNNKIGSVERRTPAIGGLVYFKIKNGQITQEKILCKMPEPRGVDIKNGNIAFSSDKTVYVFNGETIQQLNNEWFSYIHTVEFSPFNQKNILISSSGLDAFFEFDYMSKQKTYEWFAWENGINEGFDSSTNQPFKITRQYKKAQEYTDENIAHRYIDNPEKDYLPTAHRAAFINSVHYGLNENEYIATLFHKGEVRKIKENGSTTVLINQLTSPHGGQELNTNHFLATNTRGGKVVEVINNEQHVYSFTQLDKNKVDGKEWIQNTHRIGNELLLSIDSNRNEFIIFDTTKKQKSRVTFNANWAIQDFSTISCQLDLTKLEEKLAIILPL